MGGCNQSKVVRASVPVVGGFSAGKLKKRSVSIRPFWKNRRNRIQVAPALPEDQHTTTVSERTIVATNELPTPTHLRPRHGGCPSPALSEESFSRYMVAEDTVDAGEVFEEDCADHQQTSDLRVLGTPLFTEMISRRRKLHARQESQEILRQLRDAGIVTRRPGTRDGPGSVPYEYLVSEEFAEFLAKRRPPPRLQKLKKARKLRVALGDAESRQETENCS